ncbi:hypothetical protein DRQ33_08230 [bacterium]|nr:MAG: hypothetical protein DRQ33_08230 [bacterium]
MQIFIGLIFFVCPAWGIGAITFVGADTATHHQTDSLSFQDALYEVVDSLGHREITRIYLYGGGDDDFFVASGSYFEVDSLVDTLDIEADNSPQVKDHIYIKGDHVHVYGIENSFLYIEISSMITFYGAINIFSYAHNTVVEDCVISGAFTGINNFGKNTDVKHVRINNCNFGIHSDAESTYIYDARIDSCSVKGIMGDNAAAGSNCMDVTKALISNCPTGCYFYSNIPVTLDRVTVLDFDSLGICNTSSFSYLKCKRCLVYKDSYDAGDYCYVNATFENAWTGTNDNVAMGGSCPGNYDTTGCTASNFTSYDGYPDIDTYKRAAADIAIDSSYTYVY